MLVDAEVESLLVEHERMPSGGDLVVDVEEILDDHLGVPDGFRHPERPWLVNGVGGRHPGPTAVDECVEQHDDYEHKDDEQLRVSNRFLFLNLLLDFLFEVIT